MNSGTRRNAVAQSRPSDSRFATKNGRSPGCHAADREVVEQDAAAQEVDRQPSEVDGPLEQLRRLALAEPAQRRPEIDASATRRCAATSRAMAIVIARRPKRTAQCARRRARNFTG